MPAMPTQAKVIAVLCADIHLSAKAPAARSSEPDWFATMGRYLDELGGLAKEHNVPILCAGDVFHRWNSPPELINFALDRLPQMFAVPGQHDLPFHNYEDIHKSAYGTMMRCDRIVSLEPNRPHLFGTGGVGMVVTGVPWGFPIPPASSSGKGKYLRVAVVHHYCGMPGHAHPVARPQQMLRSFKETLAGYNVAVFGDNHDGFMAKVGDCRVLNCGGFMRRNTNEFRERPSVGLLHADGEITIHRLDQSKDRPMVVTEGVKADEKMEVSFEHFINELNAVGDHGLHYGHALESFIRYNKPSRATAAIIRKALDVAESTE